MGKKRLFIIPSGATVHPSDDSIGPGTHSNTGSVNAAESKVNARVRLIEVIYLQGSTATPGNGLTIGDKTGTAYLHGSSQVLSFSAPPAEREAFSIDCGGVMYDNGLSATSTAGKWAVVYESLG